MRKPGTYGPRVIGQEQFDQEQKIVTRQANIYGPRVVDDHPANEKLKKAQAVAAAASEKARKADGAQEKAAARKKVLAAREKVAEARRELAQGLEDATPVTPERVVREPADPLNETPPEYPEGVGSVKATDEIPDSVANTDWSDLTIDDLERHLDTFPNASVPALEAELQRSDPRKGALRAIMAAEMKRAGGAREAVVKRIEEVL